VCLAGEGMDSIYSLQSPPGDCNSKRKSQARNRIVERYSHSICGYGETRSRRFSQIELVKVKSKKKRNKK